MITDDGGGVTSMAFVYIGRLRHLRRSNVLHKYAVQLITFAPLTLAMSFYPCTACLFASMVHKQQPNSFSTRRRRYSFCFGLAAIVIRCTFWAGVQTPKTQLPIED